MSFLAKLFINGRKINVISSRIKFFQPIGPHGKPSAHVKGGLFYLDIEMDGNIDLLHQAVAPDQMIEGYIRFYKRDGMSKLEDYEFKDTHIFRYEVTQEASGGKPAVVSIGFTPGILKIGSVTYLKPWHISAINPIKVQPMPTPRVEETPNLMSAHYTDQEGNLVEELYEDTLVLVIESRDAVGKVVDIDLSDDDFDFKYQGQLLEDDMLRNIKIKSNYQKITLEVIS